MRLGSFLSPSATSGWLSRNWSKLRTSPRVMSPSLPSCFSKPFSRCMNAVGFSFSSCLALGWSSNQSFSSGCLLTQFGLLMRLGSFLSPSATSGWLSRNWSKLRTSPRVMSPSLPSCFSKPFSRCMNAVGFSFSSSLALGWSSNQSLTPGCLLTQFGLLMRLGSFLNASATSGWLSRYWSKLRSSRRVMSLSVFAAWACVWDCDPDCACVWDWGCACAADESAANPNTRPTAKRSNRK